MDAAIRNSLRSNKLEEIKLLKIRIASHEFQRVIRIAEEDLIRIAEEDLQSSYAAGPVWLRFGAWRVPMLEAELRILQKEHSLQAEVIRKMKQTGDEERREEERRGEGEGGKMPPQQQQLDPSEAKCEPVLVGLIGAGGEGAV